MPYLEEESLAVDRMGALHTEGLGDSWANIYLWIAQAIDAKQRGDEAFLKTHHYPGIEAGTEGVRWLENCVRSADAGLGLGRLQVSRLHDEGHRHMKLSICTDVMGDLSFTDMLDKCVKLGVEGIEMTGGGWSKGPALPRRPAARRQGRAQGAR